MAFLVTRNINLYDIFINQSSFILSFYINNHIIYSCIMVHFERVSFAAFVKSPGGSAEHPKSMLRYVPVRCMVKPATWNSF